MLKRQSSAKSVILHKDRQKNVPSFGQITSKNLFIALIPCYEGVYGEGGSRFVFRRDGESIKRNNNSKPDKKSNNISNNIFALWLKTVFNQPKCSHNNPFKEIQQQLNLSIGNLWKPVKIYAAKKGKTTINENIW